MSIIYNENDKIFFLNTNNTSYQIQIDRLGFLIHNYYGKKINGNANYNIVLKDRGFSGNPYELQDDRTYSLDTLPQEYSFHGSGDYRTTAFDVKDNNNVSGCDLRYKSHKIENYKYSLDGLPTVYEDNAQTLIITLYDKRLDMEVDLYYGVIEEKDCITRAVKITNLSEKNIVLSSAFSTQIDMLYGDFDIIHFYGRYARERTKERTKIRHGKFSIGSCRGASSHQHNPFVIIAQSDTNEHYGDCFGFSFLYSGNFSFVAEKDQINQTRFLMGIQNERFEYSLGKNEIFIAPEVAMIYTDNGFENLSHKFHDLIRNNVCRGKYKLIRRPILINNWEATYFDFDGDKIFEIAKKASKLGVEMMVLDDGWFGNRNSDKESLGDWFVNEKKLGGTLKELSEKINALGMKFGIWIEPEMINENSELYKLHSDWVLKIPNKNPVVSRNQLVLDFSRKEVVDYIFNQMVKVIDNANISYIKMDMNRSLNDIFSAVKGKPSEGKILYKYMLGVYDFMERIINKYDDLFIEGCSGGGARFDAGMLYYCPQIWCSDNTDAISRIHIQYGTSFGYPISSVGSHVSAVPNHQTGRSVDLKTRAIVAMAGNFGYELDLNLLTENEQEEVKQNIKDYKKYWNLIHNGRYYRLNDCETDLKKAAWLFVSKDKTEALLNVVNLNSDHNEPIEYIKLRGLDDKAIYNANGKKYYGSDLMYAGIPLDFMKEQYKAYQIYFKIRV